MVCDNDTPDDCFILEICVVLIIEFLIYIFILLSSFQTMFFKVKISMEVFEKNNTREKKSALKKNKIRNMTNTREILFIYLLFRKHLNPFRLLWRMSSTGQSSQQWQVRFVVVMQDKLWVHYKLNEYVKWTDKYTWKK